MLWHADVKLLYETIKVVGGFIRPLRLATVLYLVLTLALSLVTDLVIAHPIPGVEHDKDQFSLIQMFA